MYALMHVHTQFSKYRAAAKQPELENIKDKIKEVLALLATL